MLRGVELKDGAFQPVGFHEKHKLPLGGGPPVLPGCQIRQLAVFAEELPTIVQTHVWQSVWRDIRQTLEFVQPTKYVFTRKTET